MYSNEDFTVKNAKQPRVSTTAAINHNMQQQQAHVAKPQGGRTHPITI